MTQQPWNTPHNAPGAPGAGQYPAPPPSAGANQWPQQYAGQYPQQGGQYPPHGGAQPPYHPGYPASPAGSQLADWGSRALAYLVDAAIMFGVSIGILIVGFGAAFGTSYLTGELGTTMGDEVPVVFATLGIITYVATLVAPFVYRWLWHARSGQTVGKRVMRIRVVRLDTMQPPGKGASAGREVVMFLLSVVTCGVGGWLDLLWPLWDQPNRQALHDKPAGTVVIQSG